MMYHTGRLMPSAIRSPRLSLEKIMLYASGRFRAIQLALALAAVAYPACALGQAAPTADEAKAAREQMVAKEIEAAGVTNPRVLASMRATPRHEFMPESQRQWAYVDAALPIGDKQ